MRSARRVSWHVWKLLLLVLGQILGTIPSLVLANKRVSRQIAALVETPVPSTDPRFRLARDQIRGQFDVDLHRLARIEEKARATVFGVALSVGLVAPGLALLTGNAMRTDGLEVAFAALLCSSIFFLLASGFLAIQCYKSGGVFRPDLEDHPPLVTPEEELETLIRCLDLNALTVLRRNNLLSASIDCLRNGLAAMLGLLLLVIMSSL